MKRQVIAQREYLLDHSKKVTIKIYQPEPVAEFKNDPIPTFQANFEVFGFGEISTTYVYGIDELQAIYLALSAIGNLFYCSNEYQAGRLTFMGSFDLHLPYSEGVEGFVKNSPIVKLGYH